MVEKIIIIGFLIVLAIVIFVFFGARLSAGGRVSDVPVLQDAIDQTQLGVSPTGSTIGLIGFSEGKTDVNSSVDEIKANVISQNLLTEDAVRKIVADEQNKIQVATDTGGSGTQTREISGITLVKTPTSELRVLEAFAPAGEGEFLSLRGTPLAEGAKVRTEETFSGVITTEAGGTRTIRGTQGLFDRLQQNLLKSSEGL